MKDGHSDLPFAQVLGRSVLDKTGLTGRCDFALEYTPELGQFHWVFQVRQRIRVLRRRIPTAVPVRGIAGTARVRLESAKGPVDVPVIDHGEKPYAN